MFLIFEMEAWGEQHLHPSLNMWIRELGSGGMQKKDGEVQPVSPKCFTQRAKSCSGVCAA